MEPSVEEFNQSLRDANKELEDKLPKLKQELESKMEEFGSTEVMANLAIQELFAQSPVGHNPDNPMSENPFLIFALGLFLSKNNLNAGEQKPDKVSELLDALREYFDCFKWIMAPMDPDNRQETDSLVFLSRLKKLMDDLNPHCYPYQKEEHVKKVFSKIDYFFESEYGFNTNDAFEFQLKISDRISRLLQQKSEHVQTLVKDARRKMTENQSEEFVKELESKGWDVDSFISHYGNTHFLWGAKDILTINIQQFCDEENIVDSTKFQKYLDAVSCKIGQQLENFSDPLSDNILLYKPIIKLDNENYFCPKPDFLNYRLDSILEFLIKTTDNAWQKYNKSKSDYLEDKAYEFFSRVFPEKNLHRNLFFDYNDSRFECDLLLQYDNKIFIIESKSSHLPLSAKRGGVESLRDSLKAVVRKAYTQGTNTREYIKSAPTVDFENKQGDKVLSITSPPEDEFFIINVTMENLGSIGTNLKKLDVLNFFTKHEYPWSVNLYDLDIVTDLISEPVYFIHYLEQRIHAQLEDIFESVEEIDFLGYYFRMGNFYKEMLSDSTNLGRIMIAPEYYGVLDECYLLDKPKPKLDIPKNLDLLIKNMQKYHQKGFTKITSLLLDFPQMQRKQISKSIDEKFKKTIKTGNPDGITSALGEPYDIGFSYFTANNMEDFYKSAKLQYKRRKYQNKITRWGVIGRNVLDSKNFATFFMYDDTPWEFNQEMEREIERLFGNQH